MAKGVPFTYSVNQIETRLGLADVVAGVSIPYPAGFYQYRHRFDQVILTSGKTCLVEFDWLILESLDGYAAANIRDGSDNPADYQLPGVVAGDAGRARFHLTLEPGGDLTIGFFLGGGGGKVAVDNIRVSEGGAGPWRRDFENGFVLANPINRPYTFNALELAGPLNRTGIQRILGTQAPTVNNGQPVTGNLLSSLVSARSRSSVNASTRYEPDRYFNRR